MLAEIFIMLAERFKILTSIIMLRLLSMTFDDFFMEKLSNSHNIDWSVQIA